MSEKDGKMVVTDPAAWRKIRIWQWVKFGLPQMLMRALWSLFAPLEPVVNFAYGMGIIVLHLFFAIASIAFAPTVWCSLELACRHAKVKNATHGTRGEICRHAWYSFVAFVVEVVSFIALVAVLCDCGKDWRSTVFANPMLAKIGIALIATNCVSAIHELGRWMRMSPAQPVQQVTVPVKNEVVTQKPVPASVPVAVSIPQGHVWSVWKTVTLGTNKSVNEVAAAFSAYKWEISPFAKDILWKITFASEVATVDLVRVTVRDLGFTESTTWSKILARAQELGLELCPADVGPQLRLQYNDQPNNEYLWIGMKPISDSDRYLHVFYVNRDGARGLDTYCTNLGSVWYPDDRLVFVRARK